MGLREQLSEKPVIGIALALIVITGALWYITAQSGTKRAMNQAWYYDLDAGERFAGEVGQVPPFTTAAGHTAVRAAVFTCGECADKASHYLAYLEKYSDAYIAAMGDAEAFTPDIAEQGQLIRAAEGETWHTAISAEGMKIVADARARCGNTPPKTCEP